MSGGKKPKLDVEALSPQKREVLDLMRQRLPIVLLQRLGGQAEIADADFDAVSGLTMLVEADEERETLTLTVGKSGGAEHADG